MQADPGATPDIADDATRGVRGRPRDRGADTRILAAAFEQLVRVGYAGLSMESVAAQAGVAKTTVYRRYPAKRDLVIAALDREVPVPPPPPPELPAREGLAWFVHATVAAMVDSGAIRILASLLVEEQSEPEVLADFRRRLVAPRRDLVSTMLRRGVERGEIRPNIDPLLVTEMVAGAIFGHHVILGLPTSDDWLNGLVDHVWNAIEAR